MNDARFLVWSNEHGSWWRPGHMGYTRIIAQAGRYSRIEAECICHYANHCLKPDEVNEVMVLAPEAIADER